ncbi:MAG: YihA family ribosome biogenesis GTP-binding protein [Clostridia bacterium]|nr:YihA family ribosome biogenesis GTP-binding protein [Clostridia bacterium]
MNIHNVEFEAAFGTAGQLPPSDLPEIVFSGKSNVGKSSLINKFFNRKNMARVSAVPGKTTTVNFFKAGELRFVDLPGYGYAKRSAAEIRRWSELMEGYFSQDRRIVLLIQLLDMRHPPTADDKTMLRFLTESGVPFAVALTKCDKLKKTEREKQAAYFSGLPALAAAKAVFAVSSETGEGIAELKALVEQAAETTQG